MATQYVHMCKECSKVQAYNTHYLGGYRHQKKKKKKENQRSIPDEWTPLSRWKWVGPFLQWLRAIALLEVTASLSVWSTEEERHVPTNVPTKIQDGNRSCRALARNLLLAVDYNDSTVSRMTIDILRRIVSTVVVDTALGLSSFVKLTSYTLI